MFIEINHTQYNMYSISSFRAVDKKVENSDGTYLDAFFIYYVTNLGYEITERFESAELRDERYAYLKSKFGIE